ncbi:MAG: M48 family metallopeptidase [Planctomycetota bacterium]
MDFFAAQDLRRKKTKWLVLLYAAAIVGIIVGVYLVVMFAFVFQSGSRSNTAPGVESFLNLPVFAIVTLINLVLIGGASFFKIMELRAGGAHIASQLGGVLVQPTTTDRHERQLLNVVEEMALASGISVPPVYILNQEPGINAFAAGYTPADAVIGVNRGTIEQLNRDELQGVVAHEFSHIFNGDMKLNIQLIGWLCGIQLLATIGYFVLHAFGRGRRRSNDENKGAAAFLLLGVALLVFGWIGQFFASLIKASISRQREYLADASAVQFTRYPDGLGGALKLIGISATGSQVRSKQADEISHMFFASHLAGRANLFATHPPLVPRIQKLDHNFDGDFSGYFEVRQKMAEARQKARQRQQERRNNENRFNVASKMFPPEIASRFPIDPAILMAAIGSPDISDVERSRSIIADIPAAISSAARDGWSARCVAFAILIGEDSSQAEQQIRLLASYEKAATVELTVNLLQHMASLDMKFRLPVMELIQSALSTLSPQQYRKFRQIIVHLVRADHQTSLFEFVVRHHLLMHLDRRFALQRPPVIRFTSSSQLQREFELMLSAFSTASVTGSTLKDSQTPDAETVRLAYRLAMQVAGFGNATDSLAELRNWEVEQLEQCMQKLHLASAEVKKQFLHAAATLISFDHEITIVEAEFFRAVAESLDCPVPMLAAGRIVKTAEKET